MGNLSESELQELASQLSHPKGENGVATAKSMNVANGNMIEKVIDQIKLEANSRVLEIGPGNGLHINYLFEKNPDIFYKGIDISELMVAEANSLHAGNIASKKAIFELTNGEFISDKDNSFEAIFTVNTIYFWKNPMKYLQEIARVLQPNGQLVIGFIPKNVMEKIPFSKFGFNLFENENVVEILEKSNFNIIDVISETEEVLSNTGDTKIRTFTIINAKSNKI